MNARERLREALRLGVDDEVDLTLAKQQHVLVPMLSHRGKAHRFEDLG
jgi:hypothetical protein